jgi:Histidine kinase
MGTQQEATIERTGVMPGLWPSLAILTGYWAYVTVSNVLYAYTMSINIAEMTAEHVFAPWNARVAQHVELFPIFLGCVWASLRLGWTPLWRKIPLQILIGMAFAALASPLLEVAEFVTGDMTWAQMHSGPQDSSWWTLRDSAVWVGSVTSFLLAYGFGVALITGFSIYRRYRDSELRVGALEREWNSARLSALRMQLSPHTLFNLLNTIRGNISWNPDAAQSMIVQLSDLLRRLLNAGERDFSLLRDEVRFAGLYLELQQKRFADRLTIDLPDREGLPHVWVPSLILQPLIENAVAHGLAGHQGPVCVTLEVVADGDVLVLQVRNNTSGKQAGHHDGIGIRNVRDRLAVHFGERAAFGSQAVGAAAWVAEIRMPLVADGPSSGVERITETTQ